MVCGPLVLLRPQPRARSLTVFTVPVASVLTQCQEEVSRIPAIHPGVFKPNCIERQLYAAPVLWEHRRARWCVFPTRTGVPTPSWPRAPCTAVVSSGRYARSRKDQKG